VSVRSDSPSVSPSAQSELDRRGASAKKHSDTRDWLGRKALGTFTLAPAWLRRCAVHQTHEQATITHRRRGVDLAMIDPRVTSHERCEADLAELAAGVFDRREETALLNHLASCPSCTAKFEQLVSAAKSLLLAVLEIDPPVGFEARFWDQIEFRSSDAGNCGDSRVSRRWLCLSGCDRPWVE
jgi:hypothetical protein